MEMFLQFGHGMMGLCIDLVSQWGEGTVILSPRDLKEKQIENFSKKIIAAGGMTLLDPQLYDPRGDHKTLSAHEYWPDRYSTATFMSAGSLSQLVNDLKRLNDLAGVDSFIVPSLYCTRVEEMWYSIQETILSLVSQQADDMTATLCLSSDVIRSEEQINMLLEKVEDWDVSGYYVVPEHPSGDYLVEDPLWLSNLLSLCAGLKLFGKKVILGYSNHQMLMCSCANIDAIASGNYMNVRSFALEKFHQPDPDDVKRKRTWYYCPQAYSEFKPEFLDIAFKRGVLQPFAAKPAHISNYADMLFAGAYPTTTNYKEPDSFRHYLSSLFFQSKNARKNTFDETIDYHRNQLKEAREIIEFAHKYGIRGQKGDFENCIDANIAALETFYQEKGFLIERSW